MQAENSRPTSGRWTTRDILTFVVFNLVIVFLTMAAKMIEDMLLAPQNTFFVGLWLFPLLSTPFFVVDGGRIVQRGTHEELMREQGIYRRFIEVRREAAGWRMGGASLVKE